MKTNTPLQRNLALDGLRGLASIGVCFFWHYQHFKPQFYPFSQKAYWLYHHGYILVELFFVLSGYIFYTVYGDKISNHQLSFKKYSILRFSRLYPLHWLTLVIVFLLQLIRLGQSLPFWVYQFNSPFSFLLNILLLQNGWVTTNFSFNAPSWSISVELFAYLLFFIIFYFSKNSKKYLLGCIFVIFIGCILRTYNWNFPLVNGQIIRVLLGFFTGCLLGVLCKFYKKNLMLKRAVIIISLMIIATLSIIPIIKSYKALGSWTVFYTLFFFPSLIILVLNINLLNKILSLKPLIVLGELSYSIYLVHFPMQLLVKTLDDIFLLNINYSSRLFFVGFSLSVIILSAIIHYWFELPIQKLLRLKLLHEDNIQTS